MLKYFRKGEGDLQINTTVGDASEAAIPYAPSRSMTGISPDWGVLFVVFSLVLIGTLMVFQHRSLCQILLSIKLPLMLSSSSMP
ncbi:MAG: hypothetical protein K1W12_00370, partial [Turicimonas muris]